MQTPHHHSPLTKINPGRQKVQILFYTKSNSKSYCKIYSINDVKVPKSVTFKVTANIMKYLKFKAHNQNSNVQNIEKDLNSKSINDNQNSTPNHYNNNDINN